MLMVGSIEYYRYYNNNHQDSCCECSMEWKEFAVCRIATPCPMSTCSPFVCSLFVQQVGLIAMASNLLGMASNLIAMASNLLAKASNLIAMASNLIAMASNPMASSLLVMYIEVCPPPWSSSFGGIGGVVFLTSPSTLGLLEAPPRGPTLAPFGSFL